MTRIRSEATALRVYVALRDNATLYQRGNVTYEAFHAVNLALWRRVERGGRATVERVSDLLLADFDRKRGLR